MRPALVFLILGTVLLAGCQAPLSPTPNVVRTCTVAGCGPALKVVFKERTPQSYILEVATPDDHTMSVQCVDGQGQYPEDYFPRAQYPLCTAEGVEFIGYLPDMVTITITLDTTSRVRDFSPVYETYYPNGPNCAPICRRGQVVFALSESDDLHHDFGSGQKTQEP